MTAPQREPGEEEGQPFDGEFDVIAGQVEDAQAMLRRGPDDFLRWPFGPVQTQVGGMAKGDVWYLCAFSGGGKTTFLLSAIDRWRQEGKRVFVMPLETRPKDWRVRWACHTLGINGGDVMNGAYLDWPDAEDVKRRIMATLAAQKGDALKEGGLWVDPVSEINARELVQAIEDAAAWGADVVVVDHIDHIQAKDGSNLYTESVQVNKLALKLAQTHGVRLVLSSQLNLTIAKASGGDKLAKYAPPQVEHVYMGGHKIHVATGMLGLFRPIREREPGEGVRFDGTRKVDPYAEAVKAARAGSAEPWTVLKPHTMGVVTMKLRNQGKDRHEGQRCELGVEQGRVVEIPERDRHRNGRA
jgi:KaiC/GvpD/RAD55 family RecA-like ATPase